MAIDQFLREVKLQFKNEDAKRILRAFRHDPLIWKTLEDDQIQKLWSEFAGSDITLWHPGLLALTTIGQGLDVLQLKNLNYVIPLELATEASASLETILLTGLEPGNLFDVSLIGLRLRQFRIENQSWKGLINFLISGKQNLEIWRTAFVLLPNLIPDLEELIFELFDTTPKKNIAAITSLIIHLIECTPGGENERYQYFLNIFEYSNQDFQIEVLRQLKQFEDESLTKLLATAFLAHKPSKEIDQNRNQYQKLELNKVEELQKTAILSQFAGQSLQSSKAVEQTFQALNLSQAKILRDMAVQFEFANQEEAKNIWEKVLALDPDNIAYKKEYAEFLIKNGNLDEALKILTELPDQSATTLFSLRYPQLRDKTNITGEMLNKILEKKIPNYQNTSQLKSSDHLTAAQYAYEIKNYQLAGEFIEKALLETPNDLEAIKLSGLIKLHLADVESAIDSAALLTIFEPTNHKNKRELARLYLQTQQPQKAFDVYQELVNNGGDPSRDDLLTYSDIAIQANKPEIAIPIAKNFLSNDKFDGESLVTLSRALIAKGDVTDAEALLEKASAIAPEKPKSWLSLATIWTQLGSTENAIQSLRKAKAALPNDAEILSALGGLYLRNEQPTEAISTLRQSIELDPSNLQTRIDLTEAYLKHGYVDEAWTLIGPLEEEYTSDPELARILGKSLLALGDLGSAKTMLQFSWQSTRTLESLLEYAGLLLDIVHSSDNNQVSDPKEMSVLLKSLADLTDKDNDRYDLKVLKADIKAALDKPEEAYQEYLQLLDQPEARSTKAYHHLQTQIGRTAQKLGLFDISLASLQEALLVDPDDLSTRHILADVYLQAGLEDEGLIMAKSALQLTPTETDNILWFSKFAIQHHFENEAIQVLRDTIRLRPDDHTLYLTLARIYANLDEIDETKAVLNKMLATQGITTEEYVKVANIYLRLNDIEEATSTISKAIANNPAPDFDETKDLAYSVLKLGDAAAAMKLVEGLEQSLSSHPHYPLLKSDLLSANKLFLPALESLQPLIHKLEFDHVLDLPENLGNIELYDSLYEYSMAGIYFRAVQLERAIGDLTAAEKHVKFATKYYPNSEIPILLQAELAIAIQNKTKANDLLDFINASTSDSVINKRIASLLMLDALIEENIQKASLVRTNYFAKEKPNALTLVVDSVIAHKEGETSEAHSMLQEAQLLTKQIMSKKSLSAFEIESHYEWLWSSLAIAKLAWMLGDWVTANQTLESLVSEININPVVNKFIAEFLIDKRRCKQNWQLLHVIKHLPENFESDKSDHTAFEEQISIAGRFISSSQMLPSLKIGQAVFNGKWDENDEIRQYINTGREAAQLISITTKPELIEEIYLAFKDNLLVQEQYAINTLKSDPASSHKIAQSLVNKFPDNPVYSVILALSNVKDLQVAAEAMEKALSIWPEEADWHALVSAIYEDSGQYSESGKHLEEAIRLIPKDARYWQMLGDIKVLEKDFHAAKDYFNKATDLFPDNPEALESLAVINQQLGEHQIAIQCLQKAAILDPNNPTYEEAIAESFLAKKEYSQAIQQANKLLQNYPSSDRALLVKAKALSESNKISEANQVVAVALDNAQNKIPFEVMRINLESIHDKMGGIKASEALLDQYPDDVEVLNNLATQHLRNNDLTKAEQILKKSLQINPNNSETLLELAKIDRNNGNLDQSVARLSQAIKLNPGMVEAYLEMGQTYQDRRDIPKALDTYHKAIAMVAKDPRPYLFASAAYKESRDYRNAEYMLRQAVQQSPNDQSLRRQLTAMVALNLVNNLQEAPKRK